MNENYTAQTLGTTPVPDITGAYRPQLGSLYSATGNGKKYKKLKKKYKVLEESYEELKESYEELEESYEKLEESYEELKKERQLLTCALWKCQAQASVFAVESPKKPKKKKKKHNKTPKWLEQVLIQSLPPVITTGFDRMVPQPRSQPMLALPDGRNDKQ